MYVLCPKKPASQSMQGALRAHGRQEQPCNHARPATNRIAGATCNLLGHPAPTQHPAAAQTPEAGHHQGTTRRRAVQGPAVEKAVDCLRILTTGNDANKVSLFSIPAAMPSLVRLMQAADQVGSSLSALLTLYPQP